MSAAVIVALSMIVVLAPASASAASLTITAGADPTESIATQLGVTGTTDATSSYLDLTVKPTGGAGCGANPGADTGNYVVSESKSGTGSFTIAHNRTFDSAGTYLLCAWLRDATQSGNPVVTTNTMTITVRIPKLSIAIAAPASAASEATFQASLTTQAEAEREVFLGAVPDTGRGCAANWSALDSVAGLVSIIDTSVTGGPTTTTKNVRISGSGVYLLCAYFQKTGSDAAPEATATGAITIVPPCVVPAFSAQTTLAAMKTALASAHCPLGAVTYHASLKVRRGNVVSLNPKSGVTVDPTARVRVVVSSGPPCVVPSVAGKTLRSAKAALVRGHCTVGRVSSRRSRNYGRGRVVSLSKPTHAHLSPRAIVGIVVSSGRAR